jgi:hypothetical protein
MKWIDTSDLKGWAGRRDCQETLPHLIRKLIRATAISIDNIRFPSGDNILLGGWDGILEVRDGTEYIPNGVSLWEFGANVDPKRKAEEDYQKRSKNPLGFDPSKSTFVFVTPRSWSNSSDWIAEKKKDGIWRDIRVHTADVLEEWLEEAPTVAAWLAVKHLGKYPDEGVQPLEDFWEEWSAGPSINFNTDLVTAGRKAESDKLLSQVTQRTTTIVQGTSREESLAFVVGTFMSSPTSEDLLARSLIVDSPDSFRKLSVLNEPLVLIARFEDTGVFNKAIVKGHKVIAPIGPDSPSNLSNLISLPNLDRELFISALVKAGMNKQLAEEYSKESARSLSILRRQLEFNRGIPEWAHAQHVNDIMPALLVGRWDENVEKDKLIIAKIANQPYVDYIRRVTPWLRSVDSPLIKIGTTWRLASPLDAWANAGRYLTRTDFQALQLASIEVLTEIDPAFDLEPEARYMAPIFGKNRQFSSRLREGLCQSLILVSMFGSRLQFDLPSNSEQWVDDVISKIIGKNDPLLWKSFHELLPLLSEASPNEFVNKVEKYLSERGSCIEKLFEEDPGILTGRNYHTGLLWALEGLAWLPNYLSRAAVILAKLAAVDPGGSLSNRPINSLVEIFKPWHYQTLASFKERIEVLTLISKKDPDIAWTLLVRLLPEDHDSAFPTHKLRWKWGEVDKKKLSDAVLYKEIWDTHTFIVGLLIQMFDNTEEKAAVLVKESTKLSAQDRDSILVLIEKSIDKIEHTKNLVWHELREILSRHRSYPDTDWAFSEDQLKPYEKLYLLTEPKDPLAQVIWMFEEDHWPRFIEGYNHKTVSIKDQEQYIKERRTEGLRKITDKYGLDKVKHLSATVRQPWELGDCLGHIINSDEEILSVCELLKEPAEDRRFVHSFIYRMMVLKGFAWIVKLYHQLKEKGFAAAAVTELLVPLDQTEQLWKFIESEGAEVKEIYWQKMFPRFIHAPKEIKNLGLKNLIQAKRFFSAVGIGYLIVDDLSTEIIVETLEKARTEQASEPIRWDSHQVQTLFEALDERKDLDIKTLSRLEWLYLPALASYASGRKPKVLHNELATNPQFFIQVVNELYRPEHQEDNEVVPEKIEEPKLAQLAYRLLDSWKTIPGVEDNGSINHQVLKDWVNQVRALGKESKRLQSVDGVIGQVLAHYPEGSQPWPPNEICDILQSVNSEKMLSNFGASTMNKRSFSSRGPFDGGEIERGHAKFFRKLAAEHQNKFPAVAEVLNNIAKTFEQRAKRIDEEAEQSKLEH